MDTQTIDTIYTLLTDAYPQLEVPSVTQISRNTHRNPYKVLISTLISLRTKDEVTLEASLRLFTIAETPHAMVNTPKDVIARTIYPASFFNNKAETILSVSRTLLEQYDGNVPDDLDELLKLKGVGRKTANLVMVEGYGVPAVCVDTHVHRICNRLGLVDTKDADRTEMALREKLPQKYWTLWNEILVAWGRNICTPQSPHCSTCTLQNFCEKRGVHRWR